MNARKNFLQCMNFDKVEERLPAFEWAKWWEVTLQRWENEGLPRNLDSEQIKEFFGLDKARRLRYRSKGPEFPDLEFGNGIVKDAGDYIKVKQKLFDMEQVKNNTDFLNELKINQQNEGMITWIGIDGFFWLPRDLFGIEKHFYAFYDNAELMHQINSDLLEYNLFLIEKTCSTFTPDFITISEDMSYNNGPMISKQLFDEFIKPYYLKLIPVIKKHNIIPFIDTDGDVIKLIDWLIDCGIEGILPLERQAGVDIAEIRGSYPKLKMIGGFDKTIMHKGTDAMVAEFERILPVMKSGGYIPSVDHQTPPDVSLGNYKMFVSLLKEYCRKAVC